MRQVSFFKSKKTLSFQILIRTMIILLFAELIEAKKAQGAQSNTLLVSATPHYFFLEEFLDILSEDIVTIDSFNKSRYRIEFRTYNNEETSPLISELQDENTFVISNTARDAQLLKQARGLTISTR